jgi:hypothetical protein
MRSSFAAFLRGFTLPFGVTSGRRIVFDGVAGVITVYRADGSVSIQVGGPSAGGDNERITFPTGDVDEDFPPQLGSFKTGAGATRNIGLTILSGAMTGGPSPHAQLRLRSASQDGTTEPSTIEMNADGRLQIGVASGANDPAGEATLVAGTVTVLNTSVVADSIILLSRRVLGGAPGNLSYTLIAGTSFTINSDNAADNGTISWLMLDRLG